MAAGALASAPAGQACAQTMFSSPGLDRLQDMTRGSAPPETPDGPQAPLVDPSQAGLDAPAGEFRSPNPWEVGVPVATHGGRENWESPREGLPMLEDPAVDQRSRFDLGERITAITQGRVQIEGGYVFTLDRHRGVAVAEHAVPDFLLRAGLTERLELRVGWPGYVATAYDEAGSTDWDDRVLDPNVGFMLDVFPQSGWRPQTAVLAAVPITLEGNPFALAGLQPLGQVLYCWYLGERASLGGTTGFALFHERGDHFTQVQQSASFDYLFTERLGGFAEWTVLVDCGSDDDGAQHMLGGGFSFLWTDALQVSWRAALGLNDRAPDFLTGVRCALTF